MKETFHRSQPANQRSQKRARGDRHGFHQSFYDLWSVVSSNQAKRQETEAKGEEEPKQKEITQFSSHHNG